MRQHFSKVLGTIGYIIQYGCVAHCTFEYVGDVVVCQGPSMEPTIHSNDVLLTEHFTPRYRKLAKGDVVIAKCPNNPKQLVCKRVAALAGEEIPTGFLVKAIVPKGHVWLEGDNRYNSMDSRTYGPVPQGLVRSRAIMKVWPLNDVKSLTR